MKGFESVLCKFVDVYNYRPQRSCGKVMFSQASVVLFTGKVWQTTAADGTHPTGMHSCFINFKYTGSHEYGLNG